MVSRKNIALFFSYNEGWIGGTYYILSLIHALNQLPDDEKPHITIVCNNEEEYLVAVQTHYPYLSKHLNNELKTQLYFNLLERVLNKIGQKINGKNIIVKKQYLNTSIPMDVVFPCPIMGIFDDVKDSIFWIPDFQEHYFPELFTNAQDEKLWRYNFGKFIADNQLSLVVSSHDVQNDFNNIYPKNNAKVMVIPFAVTHPTFQHLDINHLKEKYKIYTSYFFTPNQFWTHKNHKVVIEAVKRLVENGIQNFQFLFSGKEIDFRNPDFIVELKTLVNTYNLQHQIQFLGFIDRAEQLQLMNHATAVVQPSLFEGWSTVIEDAKALNQRVIASDIAVHKEQLAMYPSTFFERNNPESLAVVLEKYLKEAPQRNIYNYNNDILQFGKNFMSMFR
ncbi:MAG: glycosyltransferase [Chitinophagales bacterium]